MVAAQALSAAEPTKRGAPACETAPKRSKSTDDRRRHDRGHGGEHHVESPGTGVPEPGTLRGVSVHLDGHVVDRVRACSYPRHEQGDLQAGLRARVTRNPSGVRRPRLLTPLDPPTSGPGPARPRTPDRDRRPRSTSGHERNRIAPTRCPCAAAEPSPQQRRLSRPARAFSRHGKLTPPTHRWLRT